MGVPGPGGAEWAVALVLWAGAAAVLGEPVRSLAARWVRAWRRPEPIERMLLDFYLGGGVLYLLAALPFGLFVAPVVFGLPVAAALAVVWAVRTARRRPGAAERVWQPLRRLARPAHLAAVLSALSLLVLELAVALPVGTGNTFDSGLLTTYTALLLNHHSIPLSFQPYASPMVLYPQGTTVWLGWAQLVAGLPPARTSLLVTPLFFALAPLGGFVFGRRWFGSDRGGAALALTIAWLAPWTRGLVGGSNDFVFAFPLVLLLAGESIAWFRSPAPGVADAAGFGLLLGYSAALNPVGAEWLLLAVLLGVIAAGPFAVREVIPRLGRWAVAATTSLLGVVPSLYVLILGRSSPGFVPGAAPAPSGAPTGITLSQFLGSIDPFLFRPQDVQLSPIPQIRLELAILLVAGVVMLAYVPRASALARYLGAFRRFAVSSALVIVGLLAVVLLASAPVPVARTIASITSAGELSAWLLTLYVLVGALPLLLALEYLAAFRSVAPSSPDRTIGRAARPAPTGAPSMVPPAAALVVVALVLTPGLALTPTALPPVLSTLYGDFGNVSADDLALLAYAGSHLPAGARVLIAPGSAADFLPGYAPDVVLLYPLIPGAAYTNASYNLLVAELSNGTLDPRGVAALSSLTVGYVLVTGNNTLLWRPFLPAPLLAAPGEFPLLKQYGEAYLFRVVLAG